MIGQIVLGYNDWYRNKTGTLPESEFNEGNTVKIVKAGSDYYSIEPFDTESIYTTQIPKQFIVIENNISNCYDRP